MIRVLFLQCLKHQIHRILVLFVILADLHGIDELDQSSKVLFLDRCFIMDIADQGTVQQRLCFVSERIASFSSTLRVCHECRDQLQDILFAVYIGEGVVVHRLLEVDRIEYLNPVLSSYKSMPDLNQGCTLRIGQNVRTVKLKQVRLDPEPGLAAAGSADDQDVLISGIGRILRPVTHHQPFAPGKDHIVLEDRIHEWLDIRMGSP